MLSFGVLSHFRWNWVLGALGCEGCSWQSPVPSPLLGGLGGQDFLLHHPHLHLGCYSGEVDVLPSWVPRCGGQRARGWCAPLAPIQHPPPPQQPSKRRPFWEEMLFHARWAWSGPRFERE